MSLCKTATAVCLVAAVALSLFSGASAARHLTARSLLQTYEGRGTYYGSCGASGGGCGIPSEMLRGVPYVALNTNSHFAGGSNCGRWIEMKVKDDPSKTMKAMVVDSCADGSSHCTSDADHVDTVQSAVEAMCGGGTDCYNMKAIQWTWTTKESNLQFAWHCQASFPNWAPLIISGTGNGISKVAADGKACSANKHLGSQWAVPRDVMASAGSSISIEVWDHSGKSYGTFSVSADEGKVKGDCGGGTHASRC